MTDSENELIFLFSFLFLKMFTGIFRGKSNGKVNEGEGGIRNEWSMVVIMYGEVSVDRFAKVKDD